MIISLSRFGCLNHLSIICSPFMAYQPDTHNTVDYGTLTRSLYFESLSKQQSEVFWGEMPDLWQA